MDQTVTTRLDIPLTPDTEGRLDRAGLVLAGLVVAVGVEDAFLWGGPLPGAVPAFGGSSEMRGE